MGKDTKIEWAHSVFNALWGCVRVSAECTNCYAETWSNRWGFDVWGPSKTTDRRTFGEKHWNEPIKWNKDAVKNNERRRVFCGSMCDIFEEHPVWDVERPKLWELIEKTPQLDWLLLTKRPENILSMVPGHWNDSRQQNVWMGTSVGVNDTKWRIDELKKARHIAKVLFLSCEPLLEEISVKDQLPGIDWLICGGESGAKKRKMDCGWARKLRDECKDESVNFFMKQIDKVQEIPDDLMIREIP